MLPLPLVFSPTNLTSRLLNALLDREPWAAEKLSRHAGKSLRLIVGGWRVNYTIDAAGHLRPSDAAVVPDVTLSLPAERLTELPKVLGSRDLDAITEMLHVQGDAGLATLVSVLARDLRWDIEEDMANVFGDVVGPRLIETVRKTFGLVESSARRAVANVSEYLGEESRMLVTRPAYDGFRHDISELFARLDKLERQASVHTGRQATVNERSVPGSRGG